jgi:hypothetical protein
MMLPAHARVAREVGYSASVICSHLIIENMQMMIAASPTKPISISPKGYPRRAIAWLHYQDEIDNLYSLEAKTPSDLLRK